MIIFSLLDLIGYWILFFFWIVIDSHGNSGITGHHRNNTFIIIKSSQHDLFKWFWCRNLRRLGTGLLLGGWFYWNIFNYIINYLSRNSDDDGWLDLSWNFLHFLEGFYFLIRFWLFIFIRFIFLHNSSLFQSLFSCLITDNFNSLFGFLLLFSLEWQPLYFWQTKVSSARALVPGDNTSVL